MAQHAQVTRTSGWTDVPCYNNSASAIDPGYAVLAEAVAGKTCICVALPGAGAGNAKTIGVTTTTIPAYGYGMLCINGPAVAICGEAVDVGQKVMAGSVAGHLGEVILQTHAADCEGLGYCLQASGADADAFEIFVSPYVVPKGA